MQSIKKPSLILMFASFLRLGLTAFGGPAMVAYIKELSVKRNKWLDDDTFKDGVAICQSIPGATAMQMAAYVGLRVRGIKGALSTYIGFGLPAFAMMLMLSTLYLSSRNLPTVISLFNGLQVIVVAITANATYSFGNSILKSYRDVLIAVASAVLFWSGTSPFIVIIGASFVGIIFFRNTDFTLPSAHDRKVDKRMFKQILMPFIIFIAGFVVLYIVNMELFMLASLMLRIDIFAFGGGFASLPLMLHEIVYVRGWMDHKTFMDGIALGQVTPGPIVITATFVGYLLYGVIGAIVASIAIFTPSFLALVIVTPFYDRLKTSKYFLMATKGILASFVGLLFYVTVKFASSVPWDIIRALMWLAAFTALIKRIDVLYVVLIGAAISMFAC